ncbi:THUMP-like domain-containing protein [Phocaeicola sp.]
MELSTKTLRFIEEHSRDDVHSLALQGKKYPDVDMAVAVTQIAGRQIAEVKVPSWRQTSGVLYPRHLSMEQCSSEATALYKAGLLHGESLVDLTGGFGIDCAFISQNFKQAHYVERQEELCKLALHNFPLLGLEHIEVHNQDGTAYLQSMPLVDCIFLDPARRDGHGGKTVAISDCEPDVHALESLLVEKAKKVVVKLSPMLDLSLALNELGTISEVHIVSVNNECKELLLILQKTPVSSEIPIHCVHISGAGEQQHYVFTIEKEKEAPCAMATEMGEFLYEPNASILKAGAFRSLTQIYPVQKLHINSHLYTSSSFVPDFPGRKFRVEAVTGFGKKELKEFLQGMEKANITVRNFPASVAELRKRTKLKEGGEDYIFATILAGEKKVLVKCSKA